MTPHTAQKIHAGASSDSLTRLPATIAIEISAKGLKAARDGIECVTGNHKAEQEQAKAQKASGLEYRLFSRLCHLALLSRNIISTRANVNG